MQDCDHVEFSGDVVLGPSLPANSQLDGVFDVDAGTVLQQLR